MFKTPQESLLDAIKADDFNTVERIIKNEQVNLNERDTGGVTCLHMAAQHARTVVVEFLCQKGANPNVADEIGQTPLHFAVASANTGGAMALLSHGADVDAQTKAGMTALHLAVIADLGGNGAPLVRFLLEHGADNSKEMKVQDRAVTPLELAQIYLASDHKEGAREILAAMETVRPPLTKEEITRRAQDAEARRRQLLREKAKAGPRLK